jgi:hypothetical protein
MKPEKVVFVSQDLEDVFNGLPERNSLKKSLIRAIRVLQEDAFFGRSVKKKLIPEIFIRKYSVDNLWVYNLPNSWRMIYTITNSEDTMMIVAILGWMNHKDYEKLFGF